MRMEQLEKSIKELEAENAEQKRRLVLIRLFMQRTLENHPPYRTLWSYMEKEYEQVKDWFDDDGVPR